LNGRVESNASIIVDANAAAGDEAVVVIEKQLQHSALISHNELLSRSDSSF
jgi:hypothetical protein